MNKLEGILSFLRGASSPLARLYNPKMEVQVMVSKGDGELVTKSVATGRSYKVYQNAEGETWKSFRVPYNANSEPEFRNDKLFFDMHKHCEAIGTNGWNWVDKQSEWLVYDIDSILNHKGGISVSDIEDLEKKCKDVPWVNLYRSKSGKGFHLYLFLDEPIKTNTHNEHAALCRAVLSVLTINIGFNFQDKTDCVGSIMWIWHKDCQPTGLQQVKKGDLFPSRLVPDDWKEQLGVTSGKYQRKPIQGSIETIFASLKAINLEQGHIDILKWFQENAKLSWSWDTDYSMLVCHTFDLKTCHTELKLSGIFDTVSGGNNSPEQNCFAFPTDDGGFIVRRFGHGCQEHPSWILDHTGWTKCYFNCEPSFDVIMSSYGALENSKREWIFDTVEMCRQAVIVLGINLNFPDLRKVMENMITFKKNDEKIILKIDRLDKAITKIKGFITEKNHYEKVINVKQDKEKSDIVIPDDKVRSCICSGSDSGWYLYINDSWVEHPRINVASALISLMPKSKKGDREAHMGEAILDPWEIVNEPFTPEYLGGRRWNKNGASFAYTPVHGSHPTWDKLLTHISCRLDEDLANNQWCMANGIITGYDYLLHWVSYMFQYPKRSLPYLFLFGSQKTGKSTLWEAIRMLFKNGKGCIRADNALRNTSGFNDELEGAVFCVIEEVNLNNKNNAMAYNRIKDWVTGETILINTKFKSVHEQTNTTHWMQLANPADSLPVFPGDSRIVVIEVNPLKEEIPKDEFMGRLKKEAPHFLETVLNMELPEPEGRLQLPPIETENKRIIVDNNSSAIDIFVNSNCIFKEGCLTDLNDFVTSFQFWVMSSRPKESESWSREKIIAEFPILAEMPKGKYGGDNITFIGNMALNEDQVPLKKKRFVLNGSRIKPESKEY